MDEKIIWTSRQFWGDNYLGGLTIYLSSSKVCEKSTGILLNMSVLKDIKMITLLCFFPWSTTQPWYNICTITYCFDILGYVCKSSWWIKMIVCLTPTLRYILGDFLFAITIKIYLFELQSTDLSWPCYVTMKTEIVYRQLQRMVHPATRLSYFWVILRH